MINGGIQANFICRRINGFLPRIECANSVLRFSFNFLTLACISHNMTTPRSKKRLPLHAKIADILRAQVLKDSRPGDKLDSEAKLAEKLGVSFVTVREALAVLAREGLIERRHGSGTFVTDPVVGKAVAIVVGLDISSPTKSPFFLSLVQILRNNLAEHGLRSILYTVYRYPDPKPGQEWVVAACPEFWDDVAHGRLRGVITILCPIHWAKQLHKTGLPWVGDQSDYSVHNDDQGLIRDSVRTLVEEGRDRVALLGWGPRDYFDKACAQLEHPPPTDWVRWDLNPDTPDEGWKAIMKIWNGSKKKPNGLAVTNDIIFTRVMQALLALKVSIPDDLMVVSHANKDISVSAPFSMLQLEFSPEEFAQTLSELIRSLLNQKQVAKTQIVLPFRRVYREGLSMTSEELDHVKE